MKTEDTEVKYISPFCGHILILNNFDAKCKYNCPGQKIFNDIFESNKYIANIGNGFKKQCHKKPNGYLPINDYNKKNLNILTKIYIQIQQKLGISYNCDYTILFELLNIISKNKTVLSYSYIFNNYMNTIGKDNYYNIEKDVKACISKLEYIFSIRDIRSEDPWPYLCISVAMEKFTEFYKSYKSDKKKKNKYEDMKRINMCERCGFKMSISIFKSNQTHKCLDGKHGKFNSVLDSFDTYLDNLFKKFEYHYLICKNTFKESNKVDHNNWLKLVKDENNYNSLFYKTLITNTNTKEIQNYNSNINLTKKEKIFSLINGFLKDKHLEPDEWLEHAETLFLNIVETIFKIICKELFMNRFETDIEKINMYITNNCNFLNENNVECNYNFKHTIDKLCEVIEYKINLNHDNNPFYDFKKNHMQFIKFGKLLYNINSTMLNFNKCNKKRKR